MDQKLTKYWQRKPVQVEAWRFLDPNDMSDLPSWFIGLINEGTCRFLPTGHIEIHKTLRIGLGDWIVYDIDKKTTSSYSNEQFHELYEPTPIGMKNVNQIDGSREQQSSVLSRRGDDGNDTGLPRSDTGSVPTVGQQTKS
jgi:hypothetical protein